MEQEDDDFVIQSSQQQSPSYNRKMKESSFPMSLSHSSEIRKSFQNIITPQSTSIVEDTFCDVSTFDQSIDDKEFVIIPETQEVRISDSQEPEESQIIPIVESNKPLHEAEESEYFQISADEFTQVNVNESSQVLASQSIFGNAGFLYQTQHETSKELHTEDITKSQEKIKAHEKSDNLFDDDSFGADVSANTKNQSKQYEIEDDDDDETDCEEENVMVGSTKDEKSRPDITIIEETIDDVIPPPANETIEPKECDDSTNSSSYTIEKKPTNTVDEMVCEISSEQSSQNDDTLRKMKLNEPNLPQNVNSATTSVKDESAKINIFNLQTQVFYKDADASNATSKNDSVKETENVDEIYVDESVDSKNNTAEIPETLKFEDSIDSRTNNSLKDQSRDSNADIFNMPTQAFNINVASNTEKVDSIHNRETQVFNIRDVEKSVETSKTNQNHLCDQEEYLFDDSRETADNDAEKDPLELSAQSMNEIAEATTSSDDISNVPTQQFIKEVVDEIYNKSTELFDVNVSKSSSKTSAAKSPEKPMEKSTKTIVTIDKSPVLKARNATATDISNSETQTFIPDAVDDISSKSSNISSGSQKSSTNAAEDIINDFLDFNNQPTQAFVPKMQSILVATPIVQEKDLIDAKAPIQRKKLIVKKSPEKSTIKDNIFEQQTQVFKPQKPDVEVFTKVPSPMKTIKDKKESPPKKLKDDLRKINDEGTDEFDSEDMLASGVPNLLQSSQEIFERDVMKSSLKFNSDRLSLSKFKKTPNFNKLKRAEELFKNRRAGPGLSSTNNSSDSNESSEESKKPVNFVKPNQHIRDANEKIVHLSSTYVAPVEIDPLNITLPKLIVMKNKIETSPKPVVVVKHEIATSTKPVVVVKHKIATSTTDEPPTKISKRIGERKKSVTEIKTSPAIKVVDINTLKKPRNRPEKPSLLQKLNIAKSVTVKSTHQPITEKSHDDDKTETLKKTQETIQVHRAKLLTKIPQKNVKKSNFVEQHKSDSIVTKTPALQEDSVRRSGREQPATSKYPLKGIVALPSPKPDTLMPVDASNVRKSARDQRPSSKYILKKHVESPATITKPKEVAIHLVDIKNDGKSSNEKLKGKKISVKSDQPKSNPTKSLDDSIKSKLESSKSDTIKRDNKSKPKILTVKSPKMVEEPAVRRSGREQPPTSKYPLKIVSPIKLQNTSAQLVVSLTSKAVEELKFTNNESKVSSSSKMQNNIETAKQQKSKKPVKPDSKMSKNAKVPKVVKKPTKQKLENTARKKEVKSTQIEVETAPSVRRSNREQPPSSKYPLKIPSPVKSIVSPIKEVKREITIPKLSMTKSSSSSSRASSSSKFTKTTAVVKEPKPIKESPKVVVIDKKLDKIKEIAIEPEVVRKSSRAPKRSLKLLEAEESEEILTSSPELIGKRRMTRLSSLQQTESKTEIKAESKKSKGKPTALKYAPESKIQTVTASDEQSRRSGRKQPPTSKYPLKRSADNSSTSSPQPKAKVPKMIKNISTTNNSSLTSNTSMESSGSRSLRPKRSFKIMTTMLKTDYEPDIVRFGGEMSTVRDANILIANKITRTAKFLCAVSRGITILTEMWLVESVNAHLFLDSSKFNLIDYEAEKLHKFSLKDALRRARERPLLKNVTVICTPSTRPEPEIIRDIVHCAGGEFATSLKSQINTVRKILIMDKHQNDRSASEEIIRKYPAITILTDDIFLNCILKQKLDI